VPVQVTQPNQPVNVKILRRCRAGKRDARGVYTLPWKDAIVIVGSKKAEFTDEKPHPPPEATFKAAADFSGKERAPIPSRK
jgi:hypothetical protein